MGKLVDLTFDKVRTGIAADQRFRAEIEAHLEEDRYWTNHAPGWSHSHLLTCDFERRLMKFSRVVASPLTWKDASRLAHALARAMTEDLMSRPNLRIHGDFHPGNVLDTGDHLVLIDWELSRPGILAEDAGSFLAHTLVATAAGHVKPVVIDEVLIPLVGVMNAGALWNEAVVDLERQRRREAEVGDPSRVAIRDLALANAAVLR